MLDDDTVVRFEIEPTSDFQPVSTDGVIGRVQEAVRPAVEAARAVLQKVAEAKPDEVQVKFGVKVNGTTNWLVAKTALDANFEVTLTWKPDGGSGAAA
ncbi:CU044_2847 family protein [Streptomyces sp. AGS-58]|uniref:CU044_2847 family protein n=1 Tax=unclassified Streptomyces TaxID=2593676 RepID=UPI0035A30526